MLELTLKVFDKWKNKRTFYTWTETYNKMAFNKMSEKLYGKTTENADKV